MVVISTIIVVISAVSVYDYYSARNWQQVTSPNRNDVVFENRNQKYGAYTLRRDYDKRVMLILLSFISSIGISYGAFLFFREPIQQSRVITDTFYDPTVITIPLKEDEPEKPKDEPEQKQDSAPIEEPPVSTAFTGFTVVDEPTQTLPIDQSHLDTVHVSNVTNIHGGPGTTGGGRGTDSTGISKTVTTVTPLPDEFPDIIAEFIGGDSKRIEFLTKKINFPEEGFEAGGKCYIKFVVDKQGDISSVNVEKGVPGCESCDKEAVRVVKMMPRWKPAETKGKKVSSYFRMVINFVKPRD